MICRHSPVIAYIEQIESFVEITYCVRSHILQEVYVVLCVEATHVMCWRSVRPINLEQQNKPLFTVKNKPRMHDKQL